MPGLNDLPMDEGAKCAPAAMQCFFFSYVAVDFVFAFFLFFVSFASA